MDVDRERLNGALRGALGGVAGLVAMRLFTEAAGALLGNGGGEAAGPIEGRDELDEVAVADRLSREDEPATEAVGRVAWEAVAEAEPSDERREKLGQAVHWGYGVLMGSVYGAGRAHADVPDVSGGLGYGTALWVLGDEVMVPLLGFAKGPTAHAWTDHATALGAHLAYGVATAGATQALKQVM